MGESIVVTKLGKRYRKKRTDRAWTLQETLIGAFRRTPEPKYLEFA